MLWLNKCHVSREGNQIIRLPRALTRPPAPAMREAAPWDLEVPSERWHLWVENALNSLAAQNFSQLSLWEKSHFFGSVSSSVKWVS